LLVKNGSKMRSMSSSEMPGPLSATSSTTQASSMRKRTLITFSLRGRVEIACMAFTIRFSTTWPNFVGELLTLGAQVTSSSSEAQRISSPETKRKLSRKTSAKSVGLSAPESLLVGISMPRTMSSTRSTPVRVSVKLASISSSRCLSAPTAECSVTRRSSFCANDRLLVTHVIGFFISWAMLAATTPRA